MERRVCGAHIELHAAYEDALRIIPGSLPAANPYEVHGRLRCALEVHAADPHYGIARSLPMDCPGEVWACWSDGHQPSGLLTLSDCTTRNPVDADEACLLFNQHPGGHSWALSDPDEDALRARLGLL